MSRENFYNVTDGRFGDPREDIGAVINAIIADVKARQNRADYDELGKPGAHIYIPSGDYRLKTQVVIDISYLKIQGSGHGFISSSIRFNVPEEQWPNLHDIWPGGSRILVELQGDSQDEKAGAAFYVKRDGDPRISSVEFENFCIDGLHFVDDGSGDPENTYLNGKTGIYVDCPQDSFRVTGMGFVYLEHGLTIYHADALSIHDNFIAECGSCIELRGAGQASKITDNLMGAGYRGYSIYAENFGGLLITANNVFPRGLSSVHLSGVQRSSVTANRFHSFYPGMLVMENNCCDNLISSNHFVRDHEPWPPMQGYGSPVEDDFGLLHLCGSRNSVIANHISETIEEQYLKPVGTKPVMLRLKEGTGNYIAANHMVAMKPAAAQADEGDSCFEAQVGALLTADGMTELETIDVWVEEAAFGNTILDTGREARSLVDRARNVYRGI